MKLTITTIFLVLCLLGSKVAADYKVLENATSIIPRDNIFDKRCSGTCAECFGAGNVQCVGLTCYNPSAGESCCSNGDYCPAGKVCANIEGNCCNAGQSLQDCAASLGVSLPTTTASSSTSPSATASPGSSSSDSDIDNANNWVSQHKAIIIGVGAGVLALLLLAACLGLYRRRTRYKLVPIVSDTPGMVYGPVRPGQYTYSGSGYQYIQPGK